jgi:hypothetical protein
MPVYFWNKQNAILITKVARVVVPAVIAAGGVVIGWLVGKWRKKEKGR